MSHMDFQLGQIAGMDRIAQASPWLVLRGSVSQGQHVRRALARTLAWLAALTSLGSGPSAVAVAVALCIAMAPIDEGRCDDNPTYTERFNVDEEAEYVLEKVTRNGRVVTLSLTATLTKGPVNRTKQFFGVNMVDADGNEIKARVNGLGAKPTPESVTLRPGVKTKVNIRFPLDPMVSKLHTLEVTAALVERVAIKFSDLEIPRK